ncbi:helix-turn-helix domain-containing protein [Vibrio kyushuensis]|uniref:helix-turn-helix domain-containing protein n=1 Tax=Vibrio kyushuensis TaxID=2910249 RepID=UPI003D10BD74
MQENYQDRIISLLKERGENNASLATGIGKGKATIGRYLSSSDNRTYPSLEELEDIAKYLGVEAHWLCFGIGDKHTSLETINSLSSSDAVTVNIYRRSDLNTFFDTGEAPVFGTMPVHKKYENCFAVVYHVQGPIAKQWDCAALIARDREWVNDDIVLARIGNNPTPDFFTLVKVSDSIHVWYGEDTTQSPLHTITEDEIDIIGVAYWGTWSRRF